MKYLILISLLFVISIYASEEQKLSDPSDIRHIPNPICRSPEMEFHPHRTKKIMTITLDEREGETPIVHAIPPLIQPVCPTKLKLALVSASVVVVTSGLSAYISWQSKSCGN